ncbi:MAG: hypothetical protein QGF59_25660, partial [Pirellulaceae bacterium]|nr:hypothetical protein [Pirellulaceae bacterium]
MATCIFLRRCTSPLEETDVGNAAAVVSTDVSFAVRELRSVSTTRAVFTLADADRRCIRMMARGVGGLGRFG